MISSEGDWVQQEGGVMSKEELVLAADNVA
jgi:hypothetical protein